MVEEVASSGLPFAVHVDSSTLPSLPVQAVCRQRYPFTYQLFPFHNYTIFLMIKFFIARFIHRGYTLVEENQSKKWVRKSSVCWEIFVCWNVFWWVYGSPNNSLWLWTIWIKGCDESLKITSNDGLRRHECIPQNPVHKKRNVSLQIYDCLSISKEISAGLNILPHLDAVILAVCCAVPNWGRESF